MVYELNTTEILLAVIVVMMGIGQWLLRRWIVSIKEDSDKQWEHMNHTRIVATRAEAKIDTHLHQEGD